MKEWLAYYNLYLLDDHDHDQDDQNTHGSNKTPPTEIYFGIIASKHSSCSIWGAESGDQPVEGQFLEIFCGWNWPQVLWLEAWLMHNLEILGTTN